MSNGTTETDGPLDYTPQTIQVFSDLEHIRRRPGMYIGELSSKGLHVLVFDLINGAVDEAVEGPCDRISVDLLANGGCRVCDNGLGIPVDIVPGTGQRFFELVFTSFGVEHRLRPQRPYVSRSGPSPHDARLKAANALSESLLVEVQRDGKLWRQAFRRGETVGPPEMVSDADTTGTCITFWPDPEIFKCSRVFDCGQFACRLRDLAALNHGLAIEVTDHRWGNPSRETFCYPDGLAGLLKEINVARQLVHPNVFACRHRAEDHEVEVALQWTTSHTCDIRGYVNGHLTWAGGTHIEGFRRALGRSLTRAFERAGVALPTERGQIVSDREGGLTAIVSLKLQEPIFGASMKVRLENPEAIGFVQRAMDGPFTRFLEDHPEDARAIGERIVESQRLRQERPPRSPQDPKTGMF